MGTRRERCRPTSGTAVRIVALIPARMGSSRFPGKPLAPLLGKPMIGHVYERVRCNRLLTLAAVATCDQEIEQYVHSIGGRAVMTGSHHERASDRCAEALQILEAEEGVRYDIAVMVQGDEPMLHPEMISEALAPMLHDPSIQVVNLLGEIESAAEFEDRNCIKVVCDRHGDALYLSREPIPTRFKSPLVPMGKQVCVTADPLPPRLSARVYRADADALRDRRIDRHAARARAWDAAAHDPDPVFLARSRYAAGPRVGRALNERSRRALSGTRSSDGAGGRD